MSLGSAESCAIVQLLLRERATELLTAGFASYVTIKWEKRYRPAGGSSCCQDLTRGYVWFCFTIMDAVGKFCGFGTFQSTVQFINQEFELRFCRLIGLSAASATPHYLMAALAPAESVGQCVTDSFDTSGCYGFFGRASCNV